MASAKTSNCVWCETTIRADVKFCPECGLESPVLTERTVAPVVRRQSKIGARGIAMALIAVPLMLSAAYAARLNSDGGSVKAATFQADAATPPAAVTDPLQRSVWSSGVKSVQIALNDPQFGQFGNSFVSISDGRIVSFCGTVPSSSMGQQRFISIFGQRYSTVMEGTDGSFDVLWNRVCASPVSRA